MHVCTICKKEKPTAWAKPMEDKWYCLKCLDEVILSDIEKQEKLHEVSE